MRKLNLRNQFKIGVFLIGLWVTVVSVTKPIDPRPRVNNNSNALNGEFITINSNGIWINDTKGIKVLDDNGNIKSEFISPVSSCQKIFVNDNFVGFYGNCSNSIYQIIPQSQTFQLSGRLNTNASEICLADSNLLTVNQYSLLGARIYRKTEDLEVYSNPDNAVNNNFIFSNSIFSITCDAHCEMAKGEVYYILSQRSEIRKISFNQKNITHETFGQLYESVNNGFYNLDKLSNTEMVLMIDNKMYFYEISPQGLVLKSVL